jgi:hypothetical protein
MSLSWSTDDPHAILRLPTPEKEYQSTLHCQSGTEMESILVGEINLYLFITAH